MAKRSAGILPVRRTPDGLAYFLVHPGGPFFRNKDAGAWTVAKGLLEAQEAPLAAAQREWLEETGLTLPEGPFLPLGMIRQKSGKEVEAWLIEAELDPGALKSNTFEIEWPPRSGKTGVFPEVDRAAWFSAPEAREKILEAQRPFLERAAGLLS
ncbi:MAG: NUDIX domain-containing protein [Sandaracinaceae bacterium]